MIRPMRKTWHDSAHPFYQKALEERRSQDELTPQSDPCYAWGLGGWTRKEAKYAVAYERWIGQILGRGRNQEESFPTP
jgi:hypothetical protein